LQQKSTERSSRPDLPLWLKVDNFNKIKKLPKFHLFTRVIILLTHETFSQFKKRGLFGLSNKIVIWALPPVIHEENLDFYREAISFLMAKGFSNWQLGHFSQGAFFEQADTQKNSESTSENRPQKNKKSVTVRTRPITFHGSYTLNVLNAYALKKLASLGLKTVQIAIEADRQIITSLAQASPKVEKGLTVYGFPALLTARAALEVFKTSAALVSPKGEPFVLKELEGVTQVVPQQPFSLLGYLSEIRELGVDFGVVDITNADAVRDPFGDIWRLIAGKYKHGRLSSFNFNGNLL
jgi:putative protease